MHSKKIAFFSSDARELYKADIYRALALPEGYVLHFRYMKKYIHVDILTRISNLKKAAGIIFFTSGNSLATPDEQRTLSHCSIREVIIREVEEDFDLNTYHFYLELKGYCDVEIEKGTDTALLPSNAFVSEVTVSDGPNKRWYDRVRAVAKHFPNLMFIRVGDIKQGSKTIPPQYSTELKSSSYVLKEESRYQCEMTFYDPNDSGTGLKVVNNDPSVAFIVPNTHRMAAERDSTVFELQTQTLSQKRLTSFTQLLDRLGQFNGQLNPEAWQIELRWILKRGLWRGVSFGIVSAFAVLGLGLANLASQDMTELNFRLINLLTAVASFALVAGAATYLFEFFNKK